ncbi:MAG: Lrp/AsnC ligand binding domain-containing protein [Chloroflexi bacterium]|nr:Lrp/AsnC ligand binding domain-containing protein [Chloroflexota bacterium]
MRLQDVLASVPGVEKRFVHYLESQGYIRPAKIQKARIARRDYSRADLERIRHIWQYYQRGISIQRAFELVTRAPHEGAYVFFPAAARRWDEALALLREWDQVAEAAAVYGETADIVARLGAPHESDVHAVLDHLFQAGIIVGLPHVLRFNRQTSWRRPAAPRQWPSPAARQSSSDHKEAGMKAWVLIKVPAKQIGGLVDELRSYPGVVEASAIYGETDVIAKVEVPDQDALDDLVLHRIQSIEAVESTRTFIAVGGMHWSRDTQVERPTEDERRTTK